MEPENDPLWQAAADHVMALGIAPEDAFAPPAFASLLPGCSTIERLPAGGVPAALVLHKGLLNLVPTDLLADALATHVTSFANAVFVVLTAGGEPVGDDNPHALRGQALLAAAHVAQADTVIGGLPLIRKRMPATYVGQNRVLLETVFGHLMLVDGRDTSIAPHLIRDGLFDRTLTTVIAGLLRPGQTFIDIGANFGTYTLIGAEKVGRSGRTIAIEASPRLGALVTESVAMSGFGDRCTVLRCAAGAAAGEAVLHEFANRQGGNTLVPSVAANATDKLGETVVTATVPMRTLDDIVAEHRPDRIDLIKIDVEGYEHDVLKGARATLDAYRPRMVLEWYATFFLGRRDAADALYQLVTEELRYRLHRIEPDATTRPIARSELEQGFHDLVAVPAD